jgi:hypothetical protein
LTDVFTVVGDTVNGKSLLMLNGNGFSDSTTQVTSRIPQEGIWNQYAGMFEYYQVTKIELNFIPFRT